MANRSVYSMIVLCFLTIAACDSEDHDKNPRTPANYHLTIVKSGNCSGQIESDAKAIDCGETCGTDIEADGVITLTATVVQGSVFGGWSGDVAAFSTDTSIPVTMSRSKTITANFSLEDTSTGLIQPEHALKYLGAFRLPDEQGKDPYAKWNGGGRGMTYYPKGDSHGPDDGYPGSLFSISHTYANHVSEFSIPAPVVSATKNLEDLPRATTPQPFSDITEGRQTLGLTGTTLVDIQN